MKSVTALKAVRKQVVQHWYLCHLDTRFVQDFFLRRLLCVAQLCIGSKLHNTAVCNAAQVCLSDSQGCMAIGAGPSALLSSRFSIVLCMFPKFCEEEAVFVRR